MPSRLSSWSTDRVQNLSFVTHNPCVISKRKGESSVERLRTRQQILDYDHSATVGLRTFEVSFLSPNRDIPMVARITNISSCVCVASL
ncbi:hypothetical protein TNCV_1019131 [Trichonephila clavipes]|nr:hypothetical protein TNCV_1019131 [Trichonephila clavipes]